MSLIDFVEQKKNLSHWKEVLIKSEKTQLETEDDFPVFRSFLMVAKLIVTLSVVKDLNKNKVDILLGNVSLSHEEIGMLEAKGTWVMEFKKTTMGEGGKNQVSLDSKIPVLSTKAKRALNQSIKIWSAEVEKESDVTSAALLSDSKINACLWGAIGVYLNELIKNKETYNKMLNDTALMWVSRALKRGQEEYLLLPDVMDVCVKNREKITGMGHAVKVH